MTRVKIFGLALIAVLVMGGIAAGTASAAERLTLSEEGGAALAPSSVLGLVVHRLSIRTPEGPPKLECQANEEATLGVRVIHNSRAVDELEALSLETLEKEGNCRDSRGFGVYRLGIPSGPIKLRANGRANAKEVRLEIYWSDIGEYPGEAECEYSAKNLMGSNTATANRQALQIALSANMKFSGGRSGGGRVEAERVCAKTAEVSLSFDELGIEEQLQPR